MQATLDARMTDTPLQRQLTSLTATTARAGAPPHSTSPLNASPLQASGVRWGGTPT